MKNFALLFFVATLSFALQVDIRPDKNIAVSGQEKDILKYYLFNQYRFRINDQGAMNIVKENRILANEYIKQNRLNKFDKYNILIRIEQYLADQFVKSFQEQKKIDEKVVMSYYLDHKNDFKKPDQVDTVLFVFNDPEKAVDFYTQVKGKDLSYAKNLAKEYNATIKDIGYKNIDEVKYPTRAFLEKNKKSNYFLPPIVLNASSADVLYVRSYRKENGYKPFKEVKEDIIKLLRKKTFLKERDKLLKKYGAK